MAYSFVHAFTSMVQSRFKVNSASNPAAQRCYCSDDYVDLIQTGNRTNILIDASNEDIDDSTTYFFGMRVRVFGLFSEDGGEYGLFGANYDTATLLGGRTYTYGGGGSTYGLGQILEQLPTTGFLTPPSSLTVPVGSYSRADDEFLYFASDYWDQDCVVPVQSGVVVGSSSARINIRLNTPSSRTKIRMPLLYVPQAFVIADTNGEDNLWLWCYPMIYNAQGVPYGS